MPRVVDKPFQIDRSQVFNLFKWTLILFNGLLILVVLGGICLYFWDNERKPGKHNGLAETEDPESSGQFSPVPPAFSSEPKLAWVLAMLAFAMMLAIPCLGFIGSIKENICLLVIYGTVFVVQTIVALIFGSLWFIPALFIAVAAMGLVFLIRAESYPTQKNKRSDGRRFPCCNQQV